MGALGANFAGHVDSSGIGTGDHKGEKSNEKKQAESCCEPKRNAGKEERLATPFHFLIIDRFLAKHRTTSLKSEGELNPALLCRQQFVKHQHCGELALLDY